MSLSCRPPRSVVGGALAAFLGLLLLLLPPPGKAVASPFQWRGVIQAGYGPTFSHRERLRLLGFLAGHGFNGYVHAPKEDPYQRVLWRDPYPPAQQAEFDQEIGVAAEAGIEWIANVSPGVPLFPDSRPPPPGTTPSAPICFSCPGDLQALMAKLAPFQSVGVRTFMISFDDVRREFTDSADVTAYGVGDEAYGRANADLLNRVLASLRSTDPAARLLTVGADYKGTGDSAYLRGLRETLDPGIGVMWTGRRIQSRPLSADDADKFGAQIGRTPIVWENWTTTDIIRPSPDAPPTRVFLGPYVRRPGLAGHVQGFFFNLGNEADLNMLPLATAADWMSDPHAYRARRSFLTAVRHLAGRRAAPALRAFAETSYSTTLAPRIEAPTFTRRAAGLLRARGEGGGSSQAARLRRELRLVVHARGRLRHVKRLRPFVRQARPFLRSAGLAARAGLLATKLLTGERGPRHTRARLRKVMARSRSLRPQTYGSRTHVFGLRGNVMDSYVSRARRLDRARR
jgi:hyaluronoglucosaminidase